MSDTLDMLKSPAGNMAEQLRDMLDVGKPVYLLIDPLGGEPLAVNANYADGSDRQTTRVMGWGRPITPITLHPSVPVADYQQPYLVTLSGRDDELLATTLGLAEAEHIAATSGGLDGSGAAHHRMAGWLQSPLPAERLAIRLSASMRLRLQTRTDLSYLRLADRRTLGLLRHVLGEERLGLHLPAIERWCYLDIKGDLVQLRSKTERYATLVLSKMHWDVMALAEPVNRTLAKYIGERQHRAHTGSPGISELYNLAINAVIDAQSVAARYPHRFLSVADLSTWCALTLNFKSLPELPNVLQLLSTQASEDEPAEPVRHLHKRLQVMAEQSVWKG